MTFPASSDALVVRTAVPAETNYKIYLKQIKFDFFYACAYCFISEQEAHGIAFEIDHYLPKSARPDLQNEYSNLMFSCEMCNRYKSSRLSPDAEKAIGWRFFRTDRDFFGDHYIIFGETLVYKTSVGEYTVEYLYLNRSSLKKLRSLRARTEKCDEYLSIGMLWLKSFHIDRLPQNLRLRGKAMIKEAIDTGDHIKDSAELVRRINRSELLDPDENDDLRERKRRLKLLRDKMLSDK